MIEETVGSATGQHLSLHFFIPSHLADPEWVTLSFCRFQMSTGLTPDSALARGMKITSRYLVYHKGGFKEKAQKHTAKHTEKQTRL